MLPKPIVYRLDIVSHKRYPVNELFRLVRKGDTIIFDEKNEIDGRGLYVLKDRSSILKLKEKKLMSRYRIPAEVVERLEACLERS